MTDDKECEKIYRKLFFYYYNKIPVYFKIRDSNGNIFWRIGFILDLNHDKYTLVLKENVLGELPFLLEDILIDSINSARSKT